MTITSKQCLAARVLTQVDRQLLSSTSGVPVSVIARFEKTTTLPSTEELGRLQRGLESLGADFTPEGVDDGPGVRLRFDAELSRRISAWEAEGGLAAEDDLP